MAGSFTKGAIPPDPRVVIPKVKAWPTTDGKNVRG
jgi:hypothetical protein